jgi:hypothetical protein
MIPSRSFPLKLEVNGLEKGPSFENHETQRYIEHELCLIQENTSMYGARHLNTTCFVQDFYKFKKKSIFFSSCRNASFGHPNRSSRGIFFILKIEREIRSHKNHIGA